MNEQEFRFTKYNYHQVFPYSPMNFLTLCTKPGAPNRQMKEKNSFNTVKYLDIYDIIYILKKGIKENRSPNRKHTEKWKIFLDNDVQDYLDNRKEQVENES